MGDYSYFYNYLLKILSISKIGLVYSHDPYAVENYKEIQDLTEKMLEDFVNLKFDRPNYFERTVYPTPNVSVRTIVENDEGKILMVKENVDHGFIFPGGWCDLFDSPKDAAIRECKEEGGVDVEITGIVGILNRTPFKAPTSVPEYAIFFKGKLVNNHHVHDHEIEEVKFVDIDNLPVLSKKISKFEIDKIIENYKKNTIIID